MAKTTVRTYTEQFNESALEQILKYKTYYAEMLGIPVDKMPQLKKYSISARGDKVKVRYSRVRGRGRKFANGALSMQSFSRKIRGSLAEGLYIDIDMVNCHPVLLQAMCLIRDFKTEYLDLYIANRDTVICELQTLNPKMEYDDIKRAILSVIYGGKIKYNTVRNKSAWLLGFKKEMGRLNGKVPGWFPDEYSFVKKYETYNAEGKALSACVCVIEDELLDIMLRYLSDNKYISNIAVLTFDGVMIPKTAFGGDAALMLQVMHQIEELFTSAGYDIKLKEKAFECLPMDVPDDVVPDVVDQGDISMLYHNSEYYWCDFMDDMKVIHEGLEALSEMFKEKINKVAIRCYEMEGVIIRKISKDNMMSFDKTLPIDVFSYWAEKADGELYIAKIPFKKLVLTYGLIADIQCYNKITFAPHGPGGESKTDPRDFNSWNGFRAKLISADKVDHALIGPILNHLRKVWCNDEEAIFKYILSWFHVIFTNPSLKTKVALVLQSAEKQVGKGILLNNFIIPYVFGPSYSMTVSGLDTTVSRFNDIMMNKLLVNCDELSTLEGSYHATFDGLKKIITDTSIKIEIKGGRSFIYPDYSNYIMFTNNDFTLKVEKGCARYFMGKCSPIYKGDFAYFNKLSALMTQDAADHFFSYVYHMEDVVEVRNIPMTQMKMDLILAGAPSSQRFLINLKDQREMEEVMSDEWVDASDLFARYKFWCEVSKERPMTQTAFGRTITTVIDKKKNSRIMYNLSSIKFDYEK